MTLNEKIDAGREAGLLRDNPAFIAAMKMLRDSCHQRLADCPLKDQEGLTLIAQQLKVVNSFDAALSGLIEGGKQALQDWKNANNARRDSALQRTLRRVS